jgi:hypothetical protein
MRKLRIVIRNATGCARIELCSRLQHTFHMWIVALAARLGQSFCGFGEYALELNPAVAELGQLTFEIRKELLEFIH